MKTFFFFLSLSLLRIDRETNLPLRGIDRKMALPLGVCQVWYLFTPSLFIETDKCSAIWLIIWLQSNRTGVIGKVTLKGNYCTCTSSQSMADRHHLTQSTALSFALMVDIFAWRNWRFRGREQQNCVTELLFIKILLQNCCPIRNCVTELLSNQQSVERARGGQRTKAYSTRGDGGRRAPSVVPSLLRPVPWAGRKNNS